MTLTQVAHLELPTPEGIFDLRAFEMASGHVYLALSMGDVGSDGPVLARVHSECLTGDSFRSLRCDCGVQLRGALRAISAEGRGVLVYATGHEGRGIGLVNKLRAYVAQDRGADTVDANLHLGLPVDDRDYSAAAEVLKGLGVRSVRLMTGNPAKIEGLEAAGIAVTEVRPLHVAAHHRNVSYLETKRARMGHVGPTEESHAFVPHPDPGDLLGAIRPTAARPYVAVKYAQSIDGRIATSKGDSKWISGEGERTISHALRARCDAVMVGIGTVLNDDPQLTVRMVEGASPIRVVLDSSLRVPLDANVLDDEAATIVLTTSLADPSKVAVLERRDVAVRVVARRADSVYLPAALSLLRGAGIRSLLVEGGGRVITALLAERLVDRMIVACAPRILGSGVEGVGDLGTGRIMEGITLTDRCIRVLEDDVVMAWDVDFPEEEESSTALGAGL
jgi:GTP cyclohydrolase II